MKKIRKQLVVATTIIMMLLLHAMYNGANAQEHIYQTNYATFKINNAGYITSIKDNYLYIGKGALGEELGINSKYKIKVIEKPSYLSEEEITKNLLKPLGDFLLEIINEMDGVKLDPNIEYAKILNNALTWFSIGEKSLSMSIMYLDNKKQRLLFITSMT